MLSFGITAQEAGKSFLSARIQDVCDAIYENQGKLVLTAIYSGAGLQYIKHKIEDPACLVQKSDQESFLPSRRNKGMTLTIKMPY